MAEDSRSAGPVFEIRMYGFNIKGMSQYMKLLDRRFWQLRTSFSTVMGPWKTEINGLCEIVYIAQYDSLAQLLSVRKKMGAHPEWNQELMHIADVQMTFRNYLTTLVPGSQLNTDFEPSDTAVYQLQVLAESDNRDTQHTDVQQMQDVQHTQGTVIVGRFSSLFGPSNTEFRLLRYVDPDSAFADAISGRKSLPPGSDTRLMVPIQVSNMK